MTSESLTITIGCGKSKPLGKLLAIPCNGSAAKALADSITAIPPGVEAWWSGHLFSGNYRTEENWIGADVAPIDIDYYNAAGEHAAPPPEAVKAFSSAARSGRLPGNVFHHTPRGARDVFLLECNVGHPLIMKQVLAGACRLLEDALSAAGLAPSKSRGGYVVDAGASCDLARLMYSPRSIVDGKARTGALAVTREAPYGIIELFEASPGDEADGESDMTPESPHDATVRPKLRLVPKLPDDHEEFDEAVAKWNAAHPIDWEGYGRTCPICAEDGCFGPLPENPSRWYCFNTDHVSVGIHGKKGMHGDSLDIAAYHAHLTRYDVLVADGYLPGPGPVPGIGSAAPVSVTDWEAPMPLGRTPLDRYPTEALPEVLENYVLALAKETQTPPELGAGLALTVAGVAVSKKFRLQVRGAWEEPLNLFTATVLPSGERKSPPFASATAPLEEYERRELARLGPEIRKAEASRKILEEALKAAQSKAAKASAEDQPFLMEEAFEMARRVDEIEVPLSTRLVCDDVTPERLSTLLAQHGGRMAVLSPEGDLFSILGGRYSANKGPNFAVYLKGHAGDTLRVDRAGRPPENVRHPALSVGLTIQPDVIRGLASTREFRGQGLLARFLYSWPESLLGHRETDPEPMPSNVRYEYERTILALLDLPVLINSDGRAEPRFLHLDPEALEALVNLLSWIEPQLGPGGDLAGISDWSGKLAGAAARIAGIIHLVTHAGETLPWNIRVSEDTMLRAITLAHAYLTHARRVFSEMGTDPTVEDARAVLAWIRRKGLGEFTQSEAQQALRRTFKAAEDVLPALAVLKRYGHVREERRESIPKPGRPHSPVYTVNPLQERSF